MNWTPWKRPEPEPEAPCATCLAAREMAIPAKPRDHWILKAKGADREETKGAEPRTVSGMLPGQPGRHHCVTAIQAGYKVRHVGLLTLLEDGQVIGNWYCHTTRDVPFPGEGVVLRAGAALQVTLGKGLQPPPELVGAITVVGYTVDE